MHLRCLSRELNEIGGVKCEGKTANRTDSRCKNAGTEISQDCTSTREARGTLTIEEEEGERDNLKMLKGTSSPGNCRPWYFILFKKYHRNLLELC